MARNTRHRTVSASAPIGGLNVRDPINGMPGKDALTLVNWVPQEYGVRCRKGWKEWATNLTDPVSTVMQYQPNREDLTSYRLFAVTDNDIYNVTDSTDAPVSAFTMPGTQDCGRMTHTMVTNVAGAFLLACSHTGGYYYYDGTSWVDVPFNVGTNHVSGVNPDDLVFVTTWKRRCWFIKKDSSSAWYGAVDAPFGALTELDLGPFAKHGGKLAFIATWTIDAGEGIDDFIVFGFENGDILIYKGTDPTSASTFALVGAYYIGNLPVGRRCYAALGGDLIVLSEMGLQPLSYVTRGGQSLLRANSTDYLGKIQPRIAGLVATLGNDLGWDMILYPKDNLFIVLKPSGGVNVFEQYALYTNTNAWTMFDNIPMTCGVVANNEFYFGTEDGRVCLGFSGYFDEVLYGETTGNGISGVVQPAYSYFGLPGQNKHFTMVRPTFMASDIPNVDCQMLADYAPLQSSSGIVYAGSIQSLWDVSDWDLDVWSGALNVYNNWLGVEALGYSGSAYIRTVCVGDTFLASLDYMMEPGGPL